MSIVEPTWDICFWCVRDGCGQKDPTCDHRKVKRVRRKAPLKDPELGNYGAVIGWTQYLECCCDCCRRVWRYKPSAPLNWERYQPFTDG